MKQRKLTNYQIADLLIKKYTLLKEEVLLQIKFSNSHIRNFKLFITIILATIGFVISQSELLPNKANWYLWWFIITLIPFISGYLILDFVKALYQLTLLGERLRTIEKHINKLAESRILIWETFISSKFNNNLKPIPGVINPQRVYVLYGICIIILFSIVIPIIAYIIIWIRTISEQSIIIQLAIIFGIIITILTSIINLYIWWYVLYKNNKYLHPFFQKLVSQDKINLNNNLKKNA